MVTSRPAVGLLAALALAACSETSPEGTPRAAPSPASSSASSSTEPAERKPEQTESFTVVGTGDVLIHPALTEQADADAGTTGDGERDFRPLFDGVRPVIEGADLAICHLEVPLAEEGGPFSGWPSFNAPPELAGALADTGYDSCSTASNHTLDRGEEGVRRTLDAMDAANLRHTGSARSAEEAAKPLVMDVDGVKVGQVSFTFGFNGIPLPDGKPWLSNELDADRVVAAAKAAREAGAEVVIASLHWGDEYRHEPTDEQAAMAKQLLADDSIDLILGHHAHVVQPIERVEGKWVAYGLGNHVARHEEPRGVSEEGIAARFRFTRTGDGWSVDQAEYLPTLVDLGDPIRLRDLTSGEAGPDDATSLARTARIVLSRGAAEDGLTRPGR